MASITDRLKNAWNAFNGRDPTRSYIDYGAGSSYRPDKNYTLLGVGDRSIITGISTRIAMDVASKTIEHVRVDEEGNFTEKINSSLNECLTLSANIDQTGRAFMQDVVMSMLDEGVVAVVPTDIEFQTNVIHNPDSSDSYKIMKLRTGKIVEWFPQHVRVRLYNELTGRQEELILKKEYCAIIENPLYAIMNEPNSTLQRLIRTYNDLDKINSQSTSGKLDLIIQLPYVVKSELRERQADERRKRIEEQLTGSKYGIAYIDGTEKITQLNRPLENNLWAQAKELQQNLMNQLGLVQPIFDGTADEATMLNYENRTVEPILGAITDEYKRKFLTKTARSQGQSIFYFRDPFRLVPVAQLAEIADKFTRNEILTPNEVRSEIGYKPSQDPNADELRNRNISQSAEEIAAKNGNLPMDNQIENPEEQQSNTEAPNEEVSNESVEQEESNDDNIQAWIELLSGNG